MMVWEVEMMEESGFLGRILFRVFNFIPDLACFHRDSLLILIAIQSLVILFVAIGDLCVLGIFLEIGY